jgi:hypothetical protein
MAEYVSKELVEAARYEQQAHLIAVALFSALACPDASLVADELGIATTGSPRVFWIGPLLLPFRTTPWAR